MKDTAFVGLDVHKETIDIAFTRGRWRNIESRDRIVNTTPEALWKQLRALEATVGGIRGRALRLWHL